MTQTTFALLTNKGRSKEAVALANGSDILVTHIAIGDGATVPSGGETKLYHEVDRKAITGHGLVTGTTNTAYFDIHLTAIDGPYTIREAGLYDADGDLIAIAYYDPPIQKPTPDSGQTVEGDIRLEIAFSNVENIIVQVDTSMQVPLQRLTVCPWIPVKSVAFLNPPSEPKVGDAYVIPDRATGVWKGQSQKIAEFTSAGWAITETPDGHGIGLPDGSVYIKIAGKYVLLTDLLDKRYSRLTAPPADTFYVVGPSGSDKNSGLKPTPENGFATIQGAIDAITRSYITQGTITLKISPGTYDGFSINSSFVSCWVFRGVENNPAAVRVIGNDPTKQLVRGCVVNASVVAELHNMTLAGYYDCIMVNDGKMEIYDCNIEMSGLNHSYGVVCHRGNLSCFGKVWFYGKGIAAFAAANAGYIMLGYSDLGMRKALDVYYNADVQVQSNFWLFNSGVVQFQPAAATFHGTPVGKNFSVESNSIINLIGSGPTALPGTQPGRCYTGGQIV